MNQWHRTAVLPAEGRALVQTDVHGNFRDFRRLREIFFDLLSNDPRTHWVILGDVVHGPDDQSRTDVPELWDYPDESFRIVREIDDLQRRYPDRIHFVMGNHEHAHVGGPATGKFYAHEAARLEARLDFDQVNRLAEFIDRALLVVATACGVTMTHGAPGIAVDGLEELDAIPWHQSRCTLRQRQLLWNLLQSRGQPTEATQRFLSSINDELPRPQRLLLHGHDSAYRGYFTEGDNQICPSLFGAPAWHRRYTVLDLTARYESVEQLISSGALRRLYPDESPPDHPVRSAEPAG